MNRQLLAGAMLSTGMGLLGGVLLSFGEAERRAQKKYAESLEAVTRAMEMSKHTVNVFAPVETEDQLIDMSNGERDTLLEKDDAQTEGPVVVSSINAATAKIEEAFAGREGDEPPPPYINHYAKALAANETGHEMFVSGGVNDYGCSYIEEEEFFEDDGNFKGQITIVMDGPMPTFFMDGVQIPDWAERVGDSILVDFYQLVPPDGPPVLYVRNHKRDEDYEVTRELP